MATLLLITALLAGNLLFSALFLWLGARWVKAGKPYYRRALLVVFVNVVTAAVLLPVALGCQNFFGPDEMPAMLLTNLVLLIAQILVSCLAIRSLFQTTFARAILVWLVSLISAVIGVVGVFLVIRPYVFESFIVPSNSMAPTVVGWHTEGVCPHCQGLLFIPAPPPEERRPREFEEPLLGICTSCRRTSVMERVDPVLQSPDRILVNKLLTPRRWDMVVFRHPEKPSVKFMMRLIGLPDELVYLKDGAVWINDGRLELPAELAGINYATAIQDFPASMGTPEKPWRLGHEQYCVLGDFSQRASDSRFWGSVPGSHLEGVVTMCYAPVARWKIHR